MDTAINGFVEQTAIERQRQQQRDEILDDGFALIKERFAPFIPRDVEKLRIIPGEEASLIQEWATLASAEERYARERAEEWIKDHGWKRVYVKGKEGTKTRNVQDVGPELYRYACVDSKGFLYYFVNDEGRPDNLPEYLGVDIGPITDEISGRLVIMSAAKSEEMIAKTLENTAHVPYPIFPSHPAQQVPPKEVESP